MLLVFLYHVAVFPPWRAPFATGWVGIELFFVLSGFLITGLLVDSAGEERQLGKFYVRRALRILPLYYVVLALLAAWAWLQGRPLAARILGDQPWFWLLQQNFLMAFEGWYKPLYYAHFWSLALEVQFYVVWPPVLLLLGPRRALWACGVLGFGSFLLRNGLGIAWPFSYAATFTHLEGVMVGSALALLIRSHPERLGRLAPLVLAGSSLLVVALVAGGGGLHISDERVLRFGYPVLSLFFGALLCATFDAGRAGRAARAAFASRPLLWIGKYSYGIYLTHWVIHLQLKRPLLEWFAPRTTSDAQAHLLAVLVQAGLTAVLAVIAHHLVELPALRLKDALVPRPSGRVTGMPARGEVRRTA
jgi:peptidoglycan/LPS O-acetylase OafA/YrhL